MKHNINPKLITSVAMLLALVSAPAFGTIVCTDPTAPCISMSTTATSNVLEFKAAPGNNLEVTTEVTPPDPGGFQGGATYTPSAASGGSPVTGNAVFGPMDFTTTGSLVTPPPPNPDPAVPPFNPANPFITSQNSPYFAASGPETFMFSATAPGTDLLDMNIIWTSVVPNAPSGEPQLFGTGTITKIDGDDNFKMDFGMVNDLVSIGANFPLSGNCDLTRLSGSVPPPCMANFEMAKFEGGDATPGGITTTIITTTSFVTPEPMSTFTALGIALFCLWGAYQLMQRERRLQGASG